jgi:hypothetical protein
VAKTAAPKTGTEQIRAQAYNRALRRLREAHNDTWQALLEEAYREAGIDYKPRLTPEQKAKRQIDSLLAEFPHLATEYGAMRLT